MKKNAIKYSKGGLIEIRVDKKDGFLEFYVKDNCIGVPLEGQEAIADIGDKRAFEGAALGLPISKAFVEMLGGQIWMESKEGIGLTFYHSMSYRF